MSEGNNLDKVCQAIYSEHPEFRGIKPSVSQQKSTQTLLVFSRQQKTEDGFPLSVTLRVTVDENGKILKKSISK